MGIMNCPKCGMRVLPMADGRCPNCRQKVVEVYGVAEGSPELDTRAPPQEIPFGEQLPKASRVGKMEPRFYLGSMVGYIPIGGILALASYLIKDNWEMFPRGFVAISVPLLLCLAIAVALYGKIIMVLIWYKAWKAIQEPIRVTPAAGTPSLWRPARSQAFK